MLCDSVMLLRRMQLWIRMSSHSRSPALSRIPPEQATDNALTQAWLDTFDEGPRVTMEQLSIHADGSVAFCYSLNRLQGTRTDGQELNLTMRSTLGLRKLNGQWKIVHGHTSLPR